MSGARRVVLESVDSTNAEAARRAAAGEAGPLWIMARAQSAGRGRRGRGWHGGAGDLAATLLLRPALPATDAALMGFAAGLAVSDWCLGLMPGAAIRLKWPNDVLLGGRKIAGILLESAGTGGRIDWLAVGIGLNIRTAPPSSAIREGGTPATSLCAEGAPPVAAEDALEGIAAAMEIWTARLEREGFAPVRAAWLARAAHLGREIAATLADQRLTGVFEDVDAGGNLVLRDGAARHRIAAADVQFPE